MMVAANPEIPFGAISMNSPYDKIITQEDIVLSYWRNMLREVGGFTDEDQQVLFEYILTGYPGKNKEMCKLQYKLENKAGIASRPDYEGKVSVELPRRISKKGNEFHSLKSFTTGIQNLKARFFSGKEPAWGLKLKWSIKNQSRFTANPANYLFEFYQMKDEFKGQFCFLVDRLFFNFDEENPELKQISIAWVSGPNTNRGEENVLGVYSRIEDFPITITNAMKEEINKIINS